MHRKVPPGSPGPLIRVLVLLVTCLSVGVMMAGSAHAAGRGAYRVETGSEDRHDQIGMGPGWLMLTYKANGPMVGYLFADGFVFADGQRAGSANRFDLRGNAPGEAGYEPGPGGTQTMINSWPWGYAAGDFNGCAYLYGGLRIKRVGADFLSGQCRRGPTVTGSSKAGGEPDALRWWHSEAVFCAVNAADPLCSKDGVWSANKGWPAGTPANQRGFKHTTTAGSCPVFANIGARAVYGGAPGTAAPHGLLGTIDPGVEVDLRYVTKSGWALVKREGAPFVNGIKWGFVDRGCLPRAG
jgi:hypothetical protein